MGKKWSSVNIKYLLLDGKLDFEEEKSGLKKENKMKIMREVNDSVFPTINLVNIPIL